MYVLACKGLLPLSPVCSDYRSDSHTPSHDMHALAVVQSCFADKDYTNFTPQSTHTKYNYLDPNFYPAS